MKRLLIMAALIASTSAALAQEGSDPAAAVRAFQTARNNGDAAAAAAMFADNAIFVRPTATGICSRQSPCIGRPAIFVWMKEQVVQRECATAAQQNVSGGVVLGRQEVRTDTLRARGIERVVVVTMALVRQGKIAAYYVVPDISDSQTAAFVAIGAGTQVPGPAIPNPPTPCG